VLPLIRGRDILTAGLCVWPACASSSIAHRSMTQGSTELDCRATSLARSRDGAARPTFGDRHDHAVVLLVSGSRSGLTGCEAVPEQRQPAAWSCRPRSDETARRRADRHRAHRRPARVGSPDRRPANRHPTNRPTSPIYAKHRTDGARRPITSSFYLIWHGDLDRNVTMRSLTPRMTMPGSQRSSLRRARRSPSGSLSVTCQSGIRTNPGSEPCRLRHRLCSNRLTPAAGSVHGTTAPIHASERRRQRLTVALGAPAPYPKRESRVGAARARRDGLRTRIAPPVVSGCRAHARIRRS
jgi:hypothetical protein